MKHVFVIMGYGVSRDIFADENYSFYLKMAFNRIFDVVTEHKVSKPLIIFSGGKTGMHRPYTKSEGGEMKKFFVSLARRSFVRKTTKDWELVVEPKAISSLENLVFSAGILTSRRIRDAQVYVVCEQTRGRRFRALGRKVFEGHRVSIVPIDFDVSANRYLDAEFLRKKDAVALKYELRSLRDPEVFDRYHDAHVERLKYFRQIGSKRHTRAIEQWWREKLIELGDSI